MKKTIKDILIKIAIEILHYLLEDSQPKALGKLSDKQSIFLYNVAKLVIYAHDVLKIKLTGGELWRHPIMQQYYVQKKLSKTNNSKHLDRLAIDLNVFIDDQYRIDKGAYKGLAAYWKSLHEDNVSGYDWNWDYNHFEMK